MPWFPCAASVYFLLIENKSCFYRRFKPETDSFLTLPSSPQKSLPYQLQPGADHGLFPG
jgi:hypothetical protein